MLDGMYLRFIINCRSVTFLCVGKSHWYVFMYKAILVYISYLHLSYPSNIKHGSQDLNFELMSLGSLHQPHGTTYRLALNFKYRHLLKIMAYF